MSFIKTRAPIRHPNPSGELASSEAARQVKCDGNEFYRNAEPPGLRAAYTCGVKIKEATMTDTPDKSQSQIQGEGDYASAKRFDDEEGAFAKSGKVAAAAREAEEAIDGPEAVELEAARAASAKGESLNKKRG
jgi:hypothetical protein